jgi:hypothetical protein
MVTFIGQTLVAHEMRRNLVGLKRLLPPGCIH